jgi:membrane-bound lytic murein transglycosylase D
MRSVLFLAPLILAPLVATAPVAAQPAAPVPASAAALIPRPAALQDDVNFWIRVYSEITTNEGFLHDERNLAVVYEKMRFAPNTPPKERQKVVDEVRDRYIASLRRISQALAERLANAEGGAASARTAPESEDANSSAPAVSMGTAAGVPTQSMLAIVAASLSAEDQRVLALWKGAATPQRLNDAANVIRFQLGQADRFREGLVRSTIWEGHIAEVFANQGLPPELASLPHVESSFNPDAYSKVGAAGLWQFMRSTGRRFMRIDDAVDERLDPYRSTEAAAQLLAYNYRVLGTWPLALTAYNHGAGGLRRAKEELGTDDYVTINRLHRGRTFGFASRNFYPSFLAALTIDQNPERYFANIQRAPEEKFHEVALPSYVRFSTLERVAAVPRDQLLRMNPALRAPAIDGTRLVPRGYRFRLPAQSEALTPATLAARLGPAEQFTAQIESRFHRVRRGDTMQRVASRYGMRVPQLAQMNNLSSGAKLRPGRLLRLPDRMPAALGRAADEPAAVAARNNAGRTYVVRRGDSLKAIAARVNVPEAELLRLNSLRNPDFIYEGQRIVIAAPVGVAAVAASETEAEEVKPDPVAVAQAESAREEAALAAAREAVAAREAAVAQPATTLAPRPTRAPIATASTPAKAPASTAASSPTTASAPAAASTPSASAPAVAATAAPAPVRPVRTARKSNAPRVDEPVTAAQAAAESPAVGPAGAITTAVTDAVELGVAKDGTIRVAAAETLGQFADWAGLGASRVRALNKMRPGQPVLLGQKLRLEFNKVSREDFEQRRREFHSRLQAQFFAEHRILGTEVYVARRGDTLWNVTQRYSNLPVWLLQQYNPDVDLAELRAGTQVVVPKVEALEAGAAAGQ